MQAVAVQCKMLSSSDNVPSKYCLELLPVFKTPHAKPPMKWL